MKRLLIVVLLVAGCGGTTASHAPVAASPVAVTTAAATAVTTAKATAIPVAAYEAAHITTAVTKLLSLQSDADITAWVNAESAWLDANPNLPIIQPYLVAITHALITLAFAPDPSDPGAVSLGEQLAGDVSAIVTAARRVPGVVLP